MGKFATKASNNSFCVARYKAAEKNERLNSREGAAEETGIDRTRIARIELGTVTPFPEEVMILADCYKSPHLKNEYCTTLCPLGQNVPKANDEDIIKTSLRALSVFRKLETAQELLLDITEDGIVTQDEQKDLKDIIDILDKVAEVAQSLKVWAEKNM